jgi:hypothetical protein
MVIRRAKIKMIAKKSIETGEDCDSIPESMRQYLAMQFDPSKTGGRDLFGQSSALGGYASAGYGNEASHSGKIGTCFFLRHLYRQPCPLTETQSSPISLVVP